MHTGEEIRSLTTPSGRDSSAVCSAFSAGFSVHLRAGTGSPDVGRQLGE
jgi:hypothetical protein